MTVLCVGLSCVDILQVCKEFPLEDSDQRTAECRIQRGGNASNMCTVLSLLGVPCEYLGTLAFGPMYNYIKENFSKYGISIKNCRIYDDCECPLSSIIINAMNGSRTIIHSNKNLPELSLSDFRKINLPEYSWIHFEGRNQMEAEKMIQHVQEYNDRHSKITISIELEKPKWELPSKACQLADVVLVGKDYSEKFGWPDMETTLKEMRKYVKESSITICAWGEKGAAIMSPDGLFFSPAYPPKIVIDTLGAGDTFCAGVIYAMLKKNNNFGVVDYACRLAGFKVGMPGYDKLKGFQQETEELVN